MLNVPDEVAAAARARVGARVPVIFQDFYADTGPMGSIATTSQWRGTADPAAVNDTGVDTGRKKGAIVLAAGAAVTPSPAGTNVLSTTMTVVIKRVDKYHYKGSLGKLGGSSYGYDGTEYSLISNDTGRYSSFTATTTEVIDDIVVAAKYSGDKAMLTRVKIVNVATGEQIGYSVAFTPNLDVTRHTLTGFSAGVVAGRQYRLVFESTPPSIVGTLGGPPSVTQDYTCNVHLYGYAPTDPAWKIPLGNGLFIATGGRPNYTTSGSFQRTIDVGSIPVDSGTISISDIVPHGATMNIATYYTDSAIVAAEADLTNWILLSVATLSGMGVPAHRYWRFAVSMSSNPAQDLSPELLSINVRFAPPPITLGTTSLREDLQLFNGLTLPLKLPLVWTTAKRKIQTAHRALNSISSYSAKMSPQFNGSMAGGLSAFASPEPKLLELLSKPLRGKRVDTRVGYLGASGSVRIHSGAFIDFSHKASKYTLEIADNFAVTGVSVPSDKAGNEWLDATNYKVNDVVILGASSYICLLDHTSSASSEPGVGTSWATYWMDNGTVWATIDYTAVTGGGMDWHLADVAIDLLINHINIPSERLNLAAIIDIKAALPNRTCSRLITKPTKAADLLGEIAWLLNAQFVVREGLFTMVRDPLTTDTPVEHISGADILKDSLKYRRGFRELVNQGVVITGYTGDGDGADKFTKGEVLSDVTSQTNYDTVVQKVWQDRWGVPAAELQARMQSLIDRYADGRRIISCSVTMRLLALEPGDVVTLASKQLPAVDVGPLKCTVIGKNMDFSKQTIQLDLLEA